MAVVWCAGSGAEGNVSSWRRLGWVGDCWREWAGGDCRDEFLAENLARKQNLIMMNRPWSTGQRGQSDLWRDLVLLL